MSEERDRERIGAEPWRDLPSDPWVRAGTIRVHRVDTKGNTELVAVVMTDAGDPNPPPPGGPWNHHWLLPANESFPLDPVLGGELVFRWVSTATGNQAKLLADHSAEFGSQPVVAYTLLTSII